MDTNKTYIRMCNCKEIQLDSPVDTTKYGTPMVMGLVHIGANTLFKRREEYVWLPRQDQLQEMLFNLATEKGQRDSVKLFRRWLIEKLPYYPCFLTSYEQLWLAFVMKEKYNKVWNGTNWIK